MRIPVWLTIAVAILVIVFGIHRIRLSLRSDEQEALAQKRKGLYGMSRRTHRLIGVVYLLLGASLVATALGWNPFGGLIGPGTEEPAKGAEPTKAKLPEDGLGK
jgi:type VI protein secretion system component VasF